MTQCDNSTRQPPSHFEHVDIHFPDSPTPKPKKSIFKGAHISKPSPPPPLPKIKFIEEMSLFKHNYIERIVNVESERNCGFRVVSCLLSKGEEDHQFVCCYLI